MARRLAEDKNVHVLVLEAGGDPTPVTDVSLAGEYLVSDSQLWTLTTEKTDKQCLGLPGGVCKYVFGKVSGVLDA